MIDAGITVFFIILFVFALFSKLLDGKPITSQMVFISTGILLGIFLQGYISLETPYVSQIVLFIAEIALVLVLFSDASRIGLQALRGNALPTRLLSVGLLLTIMLGIILAIVLFTNLNFWEAAIIGIVLAPTDAALGQIVIKNKKLPDKIRKTLEIESGLNDGLAVPFLLLFLAIGVAEETFRPLNYFITVTLEQIGIGALIGLLIGIVGGMLVIKSRKKDWISPTYQRIAFLSMALLSFFIANALGGSGFIAAFVGGLATGYIIKDAGEILTDFTAAEGQLLNLSVFFILGIILATFMGYLTWQIVLYSILSLTLIRIIPVIISLTGTGLKWKDKLFIGWFGPRGLASIVLVLIAMEELHTFPGLNTVLITVLFTVLLSVFAHGITAAPLSKIYAKISKQS